MFSSSEIKNLNIAFEQFYKTGNHGMVDLILSRVDISAIDQQSMISFLDATLHEKKKLKKREEFYQKCVTELEKRKETKQKRFERLA